MPCNFNFNSLKGVNKIYISIFSLWRYPLRIPLFGLKHRVFFASIARAKYTAEAQINAVDSESISRVTKINIQVTR